MASNEQRKLTAAELSEIAQYGKIVKFAQNVLLGKHPRVKVPQTMQARAHEMGHAMLQESGAVDVARNPGFHPTATPRLPSPFPADSAQRVKPVDTDVKPVTGCSVATRQVVVLKEKGSWKVEENMSVVEAVQQIKAKRGRMDRKIEKKAAETESDDESTLGICNGDTGREAKRRFSWRDNEGRRRR